MNYPIGFAIGLILGIWIGASVYLAVRLYVSARRDGVWEDERPEFAEDATPIHDRLVCEQMEREEGWRS